MKRKNKLRASFLSHIASKFGSKFAKEVAKGIKPREKSLDSFCEAFGYVIKRAQTVKKTSTFIGGGQPIHGTLDLERHTRLTKITS